MITMSEEYLDSVSTRMVHLFITRSIFEKSIEPPTKDEKDKFKIEFQRRKEIQKEMLNYLYDNKEKDLSHKFIHDLHRILKKDDVSINVGFYKEIQNYIVGVNGIVDDSKATPEDTPVLMEEWIKKQLIFLKKETTKEETVISIAESHIEFESIHPYEDGNGNIGRILMVYLSLKKGLLPTIIPNTGSFKYSKFVSNKDSNGLGLYMLNNLKAEEDIYGK